MKRSKLWALFGGLLFFCFAIGFSIGAFPDQWRELRGERSDTLIVLLSDAKLIPIGFFLEFEKATGNRVEIRALDSYHLYRTEAGQADVLFAPLAWLGSFSEILKPLQGQDQLHSLLSSDFQTMKFDLEYFLPVLWKTEPKDDGKVHLRIWGFASSQVERDEVYQLLLFLLQNRSRLEDWAKSTPLAFTLEETSKIKNFPIPQKADMIREISLPNLVIDQKDF